jgi:hypothetical protein
MYGVSPCSLLNRRPVFENIRRLALIDVSLSGADCFASLTDVSYQALIALHQRRGLTVQDAWDDPPAPVVTSTFRTAGSARFSCVSVRCSDRQSLGWDGLSSLDCGVLEGCVGRVVSVVIASHPPLLYGLIA